MKPLPKLRSGLRHHQLENDSLVYDSELDRIHLLNATTAEVVKLMEEGFDGEAISAKLSATAGVEAGAEMLALALDELALARLTESEPNVPAKPALNYTTRRQMVQRIAGVSAALLLPGVLTLTPVTADAQGPSLGANGASCKNNAQCLSGCCAGSSSGGCVHSNTCQTGGAQPNFCDSCTP